LEFSYDFFVFSAADNGHGEPCSPAFLVTQDSESPEDDAVEDSRYELPLGVVPLGEEQAVAHL
jgi:hypothetical protein